LSPLLLSRTIVMKRNSPKEFIRFLFILQFVLFSLFQITEGVCGGGAAGEIGVFNDRWPGALDIRQFSLDSIRLLNAKTEEEKALAIWRFTRMWSSRTDGHVPREPALGSNYIDDPVKVLNVYGAHWCDGLARVMEIGWRSLKNQAEKLYRSGHTQADIHWRDSDRIARWHMFDVSEGWYVYDRTGSHIASPDEIALDYSLIFRPSRGPIPARPHYWGFWNWLHTPHLRWPAYSPTLNLRSGEKLTRLWGNLGLPYQDNFGRAGKKDFEHGPYPVTYGNGILEYTPDFSKKNYASDLHNVPINLLSNEEDGKTPNLHPASPGAAGVAIFQVKSPYIISDSWINGRFYRQSPSDSIALSISVDSGKTWRQVWRADQTGAIRMEKQSTCEKFDIYKAVPPGLISPFGRYEYLLKVEMLAGRNVSDVGIDQLTITTITQHNMFSLPMLWPGTNRITVKGGIPGDLSLVVTYVWRDLLGEERQSRVIVEGSPFAYEVIAAGKKWEDVVCRSISIEAVPRVGRGSGYLAKEEAPEMVKEVTPDQAFPTSAIVGSTRPPRLKTAEEYIADLQHGDRQVEALSGLIVLKAKSALDAIKKVAYESIAHPNKDLAIQALYQVAPGESLPILLEILKKSREVKWKYDVKNKFVELGHWYSISALIGHIMAEAGEKTSVPLLMKVLDDIIANNDKWWEPHVSIIRSLGRLGDPQAGGAIRPFLNRDPHEAAIGAWALGELRDRGSIGRIRDLFQKTGYQVTKVNCAEALAKLGDTSIIPQLYEMLKSPDENYRAAAAGALRTLGNESDFANLEKFMPGEPFPWVVQAARDGFKAAPTRSPAKEPTNRASSGRY